MNMQIPLEKHIKSSRWGKHRAHMRFTSSGTKLASFTGTLQNLRIWPILVVRHRHCSRIVFGQADPPNLESERDGQRKRHTQGKVVETPGIRLRSDVLRRIGLGPQEAGEEKSLEVEWLIYADEWRRLCGFCLKVLKGKYPKVGMVKYFEKSGRMARTPGGLTLDPTINEIAEGLYDAGVYLRMTMVLGGDSSGLVGDV